MWLICLQMNKNKDIAGTKKLDKFLSRTHSSKGSKKEMNMTNLLRGEFLKI